MKEAISRRTGSKVQVGIERIPDGIKKVFVLDTNVLIEDPEAIGMFIKEEDNLVVIPWTVLAELDNLKNDSDISDQVRRATANILKLKRAKNRFMTVSNCRIKDFPDLDKENPDSYIIAVALHIMRQHHGLNLTLVSNDVMVHVVCEILKVNVEPYRARRLTSIEFAKPLHHLHSGAGYHMYDGSTITIMDPDNEAVPENGGAIFHNGNTNKECCVIRHGHEFKVVSSNLRALKLVGMYHRNPNIKNWAQLAFLDQLLDPEISLVVAIGRAGTGKTLLSVAAGIEQVLNGQYSKLLIARPHIHFGNKDTDGYLPGDLKAKGMPWRLPIDDNVEKIMSLASKARDTKLIFEINRMLEDEDCSNNGQVKVKTSSAEKGEKVEEALIRPKIESLSISHVRGRSLNDAFVLIDEAQNLDRLGVKTLVSRMGENSKMVVVGDLEQIDVRWLDEFSSGLSHLAQKSLGRTFCGVTYLDKPVRSQLAEFAAEHL